MKGYVKPELEEITGMMEMSGLTSGNPVGKLTLTLDWVHHDGGTMSVLRIYMKPGKGAKRIQFTLKLLSPEYTRELFYAPDHTTSGNAYGKITRRGNELDFDLEFTKVNSDTDGRYAEISDLKFTPGPYIEPTEGGGIRTTHGAYHMSASFNKSSGNWTPNPLAKEGKEQSTEIYNGQGDAQTAWSYSTPIICYED